ncbi:CRISPR-associated helicase Cas3' [Deinococcus antarcticus]|uniref:CRISPR-associated helicase Cas3 n=1 Tax=Deinococcus antarcticus TaxID=1298767 RepID=A0ABV8A2Q2_9DEIO
MNKYMGHSPSKERNDGVWQTLKDHVEGVTNRTEEHVRYLIPKIPQLTVYARLTGLLHDLGKYRDDFQLHRLKWNPHEERHDPDLEERACPHSDAGAKFLERRLRLQPVEQWPAAELEERQELQFVIANHHGALRDVDALNDRLNKSEINEVIGLIKRAVVDTPELAKLLKGPLEPLPLAATERAFLIRVLFSALVDADRLDTESHGTPSKTELRAQHAAEPLEMEKLYERVQAEMDAKAALDALKPQPINALRRQMYTSALSHAADEPGFFRLTMPTGGGKTLTSLAFALQHAHHHGLRRVIYAVPFTTIIDQTAKEFRRVLEHPGEFKVLEHHSNLEVREPREGQEKQTTASDLATENWDAAVIVTTTVRLFQETLFGTRTSQLRRLHNMTGSVIVLDEVQSLPAHLLQPTLDALQFLVRYAQCSVVLCTATQPALNEELGFPALKNIRDLVPNAAFYFDELKRVKYDFRLDEATTWDELAQELKAEPQALCIVNTRQHAHDLYLKLGESAENFHLSTNMCPAHRKRELEVIRTRLKDGLPCRVISTQLIEAGIDVDFPRVYRALGPLEAIVQAAGRCNREGKLRNEAGELIDGQVIVFLPEEHKLPKGDYEIREFLSRSILHTLQDDPEKLHDPDVFLPYFKDVYARVSKAPPVRINGQDGKPAELDFHTAHARLHFQQVSAAFQMIEGDMMPVIIRGYEKEKVTALLTTIRDSPRKGERQDAWRALQQYTINIYAHQARKLLTPQDGKPPFLTPVPELVERATRLQVDPPEICQWPESAVYDAKLGIVTEFKDDLFTTL